LLTDYFEFRASHFICNILFQPKAGLDAAKDLPALQWKLLNLGKMSATAHATARGKLEAALDSLMKRAKH